MFERNERGRADSEDRSSLLDRLSRMPGKKLITAALALLLAGEGVSHSIKTAEAARGKKEKIETEPLQFRGVTSEHFEADMPEDAEIQQKIKCILDTLATELATAEDDVVYRIKFYMKSQAAWQQAYESLSKVLDHSDYTALKQKVIEVKNILIRYDTDAQLINAGALISLDEVINPESFERPEPEQAKSVAKKFQKLPKERKARELEPEKPPKLTAAAKKALKGQSEEIKTKYGDTEKYIFNDEEGSFVDEQTDERYLLLDHGQLIISADGAVVTFVDDHGSRIVLNTDLNALQVQDGYLQAELNGKSVYLDFENPTQWTNEQPAEPEETAEPAEEPKADTEPTLTKAERKTQELLDMLIDGKQALAKKVIDEHGLTWQKADEFKDIYGKVYKLTYDGFYSEETETLLLFNDSNKPLIVENPLALDTLFLERSHTAEAAQLNSEKEAYLEDLGQYKATAENLIDRLDLRPRHDGRNLVWLSLDNKYQIKLTQFGAYRIDPDNPTALEYLSFDNLNANINDFQSATLPLDITVSDIRLEDKQERLVIKTAERDEYGISYDAALTDAGSWKMLNVPKGKDNLKQTGESSKTQVQENELGRQQSKELKELEVQKAEAIKGSLMEKGYKDSVYVYDSRSGVLIDSNSGETVLPLKNSEIIIDLDGRIINTVDDNKEIGNVGALWLIRKGYIFKVDDNNKLHYTRIKGIDVDSDNISWTEKEDVDAVNSIFIPTEKRGTKEAGEIDRLASEMTTRAKDNQWQAVHDNLMKMQELVDTLNRGISDLDTGSRCKISNNYYYLDAQAQRALGDINGVNNDLEYIMDNWTKGYGAEALKWLVDIENNYGRVILTAAGDNIEWVTPPTRWDPNTTRAIEYAQKQLEDNAEFNGWLPVGGYTINGVEFVLTGGQSRLLLEIKVPEGKKGAENSANEQKRRERKIKTRNIHENVIEDASGAYPKVIEAFGLQRDENGYTYSSNKTGFSDTSFIFTNSGLLMFKDSLAPVLFDYNAAERGDTRHEISLHEPEHAIKTFQAGRDGLYYLTYRDVAKNNLFATYFLSYDVFKNSSVSISQNDWKEVRRKPRE